MDSHLKICSRCVCDTTIPDIRFDEQGICQYCHIHDELEKQFPLNSTGKSKFKKLVEKIKQEVHVPEVKIEAAIPIRKESALAPLTETELMVLETIGKEGEKTAPEIREKIGLTREHTARLMKKLYKDGYLERDTHKMPYVYRLKEEMKKILMAFQSRHY